MKKVCVALSMHQVLVVLAVLKAKNLGPEYFDCVLLREGAHYPEIIYKIFSRANIFIVNKFTRTDVFGRVEEIKSTAKSAVRNFDMKEVELWLPNNTYHMSNFILFNSDVKKLVAFEDGMGSYINSGFLEWRSGSRTVIKKIIALIMLFPAYRSLHGVSRIKADEYWALSKKALFSKAINIISTDDYKEGLESVLAIFPQKLLPKFSLSENSSLVIIVGQPLSEGGLCSAEESVNKYIAMGRHFFSANPDIDNQAKFIYVSHPAEAKPLSAKRLDGFMSASKLATDFFLYENNLSLELLLGHLASHSGRLTLIGASSTALYSSKISGLCEDVYYFADGYGYISSQLKKVFNDFGVVSL